MTAIFRGRFIVAIAAGLSLSACQLGLPAGKAAQLQPETSKASAPVGVAHDVEAPELFKKTDKALWDGRPSLGGVWVADTSVKDPQRVIMRNKATGRSVMGALFRREIDNPGPRLQLSADAAEALGMLAGQPATIEVVALKTVQPEAPPVVAPAAAAPVAAQPAPKAKPASITTAAIAATAATAIDKAADKGKKGKASATDINAVPVAPKAAPKAAASSPSVTAAPLSAIPTPQAPASALKQPFIQVGIFTLEANAKKAAAKLTKAGLASQVKGEQGTKPYWRVIVGPAANQAERDALAAKLAGLGYADAYPVKN